MEPSPQKLNLGLKGPTFLIPPFGEELIRTSLSGGLPINSSNP